jgi:hypothetical protein
MIVRNIVDPCATHKTGKLRAGPVTTTMSSAGTFCMIVLLVTTSGTAMAIAPGVAVALVSAVGDSTTTSSVVISVVTSDPVIGSVDDSGAVLRSIA